ncbi:hypothetical protein [Faecalicatena contorta]|uniref:hypothetical protein n=1 Tax=Faecalicatena contorta TaxID=39482 RepID=UPI001F43DA0E|nr:hypothetical protein [Faecalicatena contorta]MCF2682784.1 hypothetical protein [Faecalicatena contorta]
MSEKMKMVVVITGIAIQIVLMLIYSFSEIEVPGYLYMIVWILCAVFVKRCVNNGKII